jgi:hypothetical protein
MGSCKFFLNIVTTKMSQNMTEGTFSRGLPHIILISFLMPNYIFRL